MAEYASRPVANTALGLSIGSGVLSLVNSAGGLAGLLGFGQRNAPSPDPGDRPVTRYELGLIEENNALKDEIVGLKAAQYTDKAAAGLQAQISEQAVFNATTISTLGCIKQQVAQLQGMTQLVIPNRNVSPGWGSVEVTPAPLAAQTAAASGSASTGG